MAGLLPLSRIQRLDSRGRPLAGARLYLYDGGTSTPRTGYRDLALSSEHPNPIIFDAAGTCPLVYLDDGYYRQRLTSSSGTLVFDDDGLPVLSTSAGGAGTSVDPESVFKTGNIKLDFGSGVIDGYVRANGRTIGSALSGATERANADTEALYTKLWAYANITVTGSKGADAAADFAANKPLVLPNWQGNAIFGMPDMGGTADSAFAALLTGTTADPGATAGADTVTLVQANVPSYSLTGGSGSVSASGTTSTESTTHGHTFSGTTSGQSADHTHQYEDSVGVNAAQSGLGAAAVVDGFSATGGTSNDHTHTYSGTTGSQSSNHTHTVTVSGSASSITISSGGSGTAVNKLPSLVTLMVYLRL